MKRKLGMAALVALAANAHAVGEVRTWVMEGPVTYITNPAGVLDSVNLGDRMKYTFTFDSDVQYFDPAIPIARGYGGIAADLQIGSWEIPCEVPSLGVQHPPDWFRVSSDVPLDFGYDRNNYVFAVLLGGTLDSTFLPDEPYDISLFPGTYIQLNIYSPPISPYPPYTFSSVSANVDRFYSIPEPSSMLFLLVGGVVLTASSLIDPERLSGAGKRQQNRTRCRSMQSVA